MPSKKIAAVARKITGTKLYRMEWITSYYEWSEPFEAENLKDAVQIGRHVDIDTKIEPEYRDGKPHHVVSVDTDGMTDDVEDVYF